MTIVTEKEASKKWCPLMRSVSGSKGINGKHDTMHPGSRPANMLNAENGQNPIGACIGSACMAWRISGKRHQATCETVVLARKASVPKCNCSPSPIGYCGAFGKVTP